MTYYSTPLGTLPPEAIGEKVHGFNYTQKILRTKRYVVTSFKIDPGYFPHIPIQIKINKANNHCTTIEDEASSIIDDTIAINRSEGKTLLHSSLQKVETEIKK